MESSEASADHSTQRKAKESKFHEWASFQIDVIARRDLTATEKLILVRLCHYRGCSEIGKANPKQVTLAEACGGVCRDEVGKTLRKAEGLGLIQIIRKRYGCLYRFSWDAEFTPLRCRPPSTSETVSRSRPPSASEADPHLHLDAAHHYYLNSSVNSSSSSAAQTAEKGNAEPTSEQVREVQAALLPRCRFSLSTAQVETVIRKHGCQIDHYQTFGERRGARFDHIGGLTKALAEDLPVIRAEVSAGAAEPSKPTPRQEQDEAIRRRLDELGTCPRCLNTGSIERGKPCDCEQSKLKARLASVQDAPGRKVSYCVLFAPRTTGSNALRAISARQNGIVLGENRIVHRCLTTERGLLGKTREQVAEMDRQLAEAILAEPEKHTGRDSMGVNWARIYLERVKPKRTPPVTKMPGADWRRPKAQRTTFSYSRKKNRY